MAAAALLAGCGEEPERVTPASTVPSVVGWNLDEAEETLADRAIAYDVSTPDGDQPLIEHLWWVCSQDPAGGAAVQPVTLYVEHTCD